MSLFRTSLMLTSMLATTTTFAVLPTVTLDPNASNPFPIQTTSTNGSINPIVNARPQLDNQLFGYIVGTDAQGQESFIPVTAQTNVSAGNVIEYRGYITNNSPDRVRSMKVTYAIPANTELLSTQVSPERAYGSADGQNFQYMPLKTNASGTLQNLPMAYYKAVRWDIQGLGLNEVAEVKYRVRVK
ncbi:MULTISPECIES: hypothetical protein [unclassified Moraxella]|uniref:hypothetical protein n=1 Tax=unclassified Moraxella TaxID=2685852 RepID=UPI003AF7BEAA